MQAADVLRPADADLGTVLVSDFVRESYGRLLRYGTFPSGHNEIAGLAAVTWLNMPTRWSWVGVIWGRRPAYQYDSQVTSRARYGQQRSTRDR